MDIPGPVEAEEDVAVPVPAFVDDAEGAAGAEEVDERAGLEAACFAGSTAACDRLGH